MTMRQSERLDQGLAAGARPTTQAGLWPLRTPVVIACLLLMLATGVLRLVNLGPSWDVHVDEITYLHISERVAAGHGVELYGEPFYLHPPAYFFIQSALLKVGPQPTDTIGMIYRMRLINVALAMVSALLVLGLGFALGGRLAGWSAALIFALDPFVVRINSYTLLETSAMFWVLLGWAILFFGIVLPSPDKRRTLLMSVAAGTAFGLALLTKEQTLFVTLLPLAMAFAFGRVLPRIGAVLAALTAAFLYAVYPLAALLRGEWPYFFQEKLSGVSRFAGLVQVTGFRRGDGPSLLEAAVANFAAYGLTYALLLAGAVGLVVLARGQGKAQRLASYWIACSYAMLAYLAAFGTLEEQFFYYLVVPAMIAATAGAVSLHRSLEGGRQRAFRFVMGVAGAICLAWAGASWYQIHLTPSNANEQLVAYVQASVPAGSTISVTTEESQFLLPGHTLGIWTSPDQIVAQQVEYVVVSTQQTLNGYGFATPDLLDWLGEHAQVVFTAPSRTYGLLQVYRLPG